MEMPKPGDGHRQLERLTGNWEGTETMHPSQWDPKGGTATGTNRVRMTLGGFAAIVDYEQTRDGQVTFSGHGVYTYDAEANEVVLHWFDCMGSPPEIFRGTFDGNRLTVTSRNQMGFARLIYDHSEPDVLSSTMEMSPDGTTWATLFDGTYRRTE